MPYCSPLKIICGIMSFVREFLKSLKKKDRQLLEASFDFCKKEWNIYIEDYKNVILLRNHICYNKYRRLKNMQKILIVEDDKKLRNELETFLNKNGFMAKGIEKFDNTIQDILTENADLVLLDINLPYLDGEFVCKELRKTSNVPIIMVTSRDNEIDELISLNYGADQYVTKPYNIQILLAKINGLLKRNQNSGRNPKKIDCNGFVLNIAERTIEKGNKKIDLTKNEYSILYYLSTHKDKIVSRDEIMDYLWESEEFIDDNTLNVNIRRLRTKLEEIDLTDKIETKRGQGYLLK